MVLTKFSREHYDTYISMSADFFSSGATVNTVPLEFFHNTFSQVLKNSELLDGFVFEENGVILGYTQLSFSWNNDFGGKVLWIEEIYIKPEFRQKGYSKDALSQIFEMYKNDVKAFRLEVTSDNPASTLYENIGFKSRDYKQYYKEV